MESTPNCGGDTDSVGTIASALEGADVGNEIITSGGYFLAFVALNFAHLALAAAEILALAAALSLLLLRGAAARGSSVASSFPSCPFKVSIFSRIATARLS